MNKSISKHIILFPVFFGILFLEEFTFFGIQFTILWKIPLVVFLFIYLKNNTNISTLPNYLFFGLLFAFKVFVITDFPESITVSFNRFIKFSILPLAVFFFTTYYKSAVKIYNILLILSIYLILATLPYYFGVEDRISNSKVDVYGADEEWIGFTAYFLKVHALSIVMGFASIILVAELIHKKFNLFEKVFTAAVAVVAAIAMYRTFVRTGWVMYAAVTLILGFYKQRVRSIIKLLPLVLLVLVLLFNIYEGSEALQTKIADRTIWQDETSVDNIGSGRLKYYLIALENWQEAGLGAWLIGYGENQGKMLMKEKLGSALFAHNAYIEILQTNGIIGILIYLYFLYLLFKFSVKGTRDKYLLRIGVAAFIAYMISLFFQSANIFWQDILFALIISVLHVRKKENVIV